MSSSFCSLSLTLHLSFLLGSVLGLSLGLEFMGLPNQWARYLRWDASTRSDLSFQLRTNVSTGLLLYFDDGGICDFLCLSLADGRVQLHFSIDCAETTVLSDKKVNDGGWHFLMVSRNRLRTTMVLDGAAIPAEVRPQRQSMNIVSDLFVGGVPGDIRSDALTLGTVRDIPMLSGYLQELKYGNSEPRLLGSQGVRLDLEGLCTDNPCDNGGACLLLDGEPTCDCTATGYVGKFCSEDVNDIPGLANLMVDDQVKCKLGIIVDLCSSYKGHPELKVYVVSARSGTTFPASSFNPKESTEVERGTAASNNNGSAVVCHKCMICADSTTRTLISGEWALTAAQFTLHKGEYYMLLSIVVSQHIQTAKV
ncbi:neurexin-3-like [Ranitomeya imitator]|uniref:neurexin-3-like n=1 Tax=Ranitomeya imitator TaxID=111125 RepID=UPI0037E82558